MANPLMDGHSLVLDDVLAKFKVHGRYHVVTIMLLTIGLMFEFIWYTNHVIVAGKIEYRCNKFSSKLKNLSSSSNIIVCKNPELCSEWIYDNPDSFVGEFQLACQEWKRTSVGSVHCFGYMLGLLTVGPLSDRFGRKTLVIMTGVAGGTLGIAKSFARSYWHYVTFEFLEAAIGDPISPIYTLAIEMVASKSRATYTTICMTGAGLGGILFALAAWMIPYWRTLLRVVYAPGLLAIFFIYLLDESPRWLLANGKKDKAVEIITRAAKLNNMEKEEHLNIISYEKNKGPSFATVIRDTFKSTSLLKRFFVCSVWWIAGTFVYFGLIVNSTFLQGNKYLNFGLTATMKCVGNFCAGNIINKFNRKVPLIVCFVACAILCAGQPFLPKSKSSVAADNQLHGGLSVVMYELLHYLYIHVGAVPHSVKELYACIVFRSWKNWLYDIASNAFVDGVLVRSANTNVRCSVPDGGARDAVRAGHDGPKSAGHSSSGRENGNKNFNKSFSS